MRIDDAGKMEVMAADQREVCEQARLFGRSGKNGEGIALGRRLRNLEQEMSRWILLFNQIFLVVRAPIKDCEQEEAAKYLLRDSLYFVNFLSNILRS